jgi:selenide,water dikinase
MTTPGRPACFRQRHHGTLTQLAKSAGCAAKIGQADLRAALAHLGTANDPRVLVGLETGDDAAIVQLTDELALIATVDVFPPVVDDPFDYGRIAAANALSDVYAMGGKPLSALSFVAWPLATLGTTTLGDVLAGAAEVCRQAGIAIVGGHSIVDDEPKFGLFVNGLVDPRRIVTIAGARPGDVLVLTKRLGTGVLTTAVKRGHLSVQELQPAIDSMCELNRAAAEAILEVGVDAATDVTGFGLLGHLGNMLRESSATLGRALGARLDSARVPWFAGVLELAARDVCPGGSRRNLAYAASRTVFAPTVPAPVPLLLADAQTSGGLLIAVAPDRQEALLAALEQRGVGVRAVIGRITEAASTGHIEVA